MDDFIQNNVLKKYQFTNTVINFKNLFFDISSFVQVKNLENIVMNVYFPAILCTNPGAVIFYEKIFCRSKSLPAGWLLLEFYSILIYKIHLQFYGLPATIRIDI